VLVPGAKLEKVASGFFNISGGAVDGAGDVYFVDAKWQTIYCWSASTHQLSKFVTIRWIRSNCFSDKAGDLVVVSYAGAGIVYAFKLGATDDSITRLQAVPAEPRPGMTPVLPVDYWRNENDFLDTATVKQPYHSFLRTEQLFFPPGRTCHRGTLLRLEG